MEETLVSEDSSDKQDGDNDGADSPYDEYDEEEDRATVNRQINQSKSKRYSSADVQGRKSHPATKYDPNKVYGGG